MVTQTVGPRSEHELEMASIPLRRRLFDLFDELEMRCVAPLAAAQISDPKRNC